MAKSLLHDLSSYQMFDKEKSEMLDANETEKRLLFLISTGKIFQIVSASNGQHVAEIKDVSFRYQAKFNEEVG